MLYDTLKKDNLMALKEHNQTARNILGIVITRSTLLLTEKRGNGQEMTDADVLSIIQKVMKEVDEEAESFKSANREEQYKELLAQKVYLSKYLPKMLSEDEIRNIIAGLEDKSMPSIMKHFKANYAGQVDMSLVSKIAKSL